MIRRLISAWIVCAASLAYLLAGAGCSGDANPRVGNPENPPYFTKVNARFSLERGLKRDEYQSGKSGQKISFLLKNIDLQPASIDEWFRSEPENLRLFYAVCAKGKSAELAAEDWIQVWPEPIKDAKSARTKRMPVRLNPNNAILIDVPMEFLRNFQMRGKSRVWLAIRAETNLNTVKVSSPVYEVSVRPHTVDIVIE